MDPIFLMKAKKYDPEKDVIDNWIVEEKIDGVRLQLVVNGLSDIRIYSRNITKKTGTFNDYTEKLAHIAVRLKELLEPLGEWYHHQIYDGEAVAFNQGSREFNFKYVTGTLNAKNAVERQMKNEMISVTVFNIPTMTRPYKEVINIIQSIFDPQDIYIRPVPFDFNIDNKAMIIFDEIVKSGGEGVVLYNPDGLYKSGTNSCLVSNDLVKIKDRYEREVLVTDMIEGRGKDRASCGCLICDDKRGKTLRVGSGFSEGPKTERGSRAWYWSLRDMMPFVIEIYYHSETEESYRLPILKRDRLYDKHPSELNTSD